MPTDAEITDLRAMVDETGARVLIWEAAPPAGAYDLTSAMGLKNVVFPTLAHGVEGLSFTEVFKTVLDEISATGTQ